MDEKQNENQSENLTTLVMAVGRMEQSLAHRKEYDELSHESILKEVQSLRAIVEERMSSQDRQNDEKFKAHAVRITSLELNQSKIVWLVISAVVTALLGLVLVTPYL